MSELWSRTLAELSSALAARELGAVELLAAVLDRLQATEPKLHAWASVDAEGAQAAAARADAEIGAGRRRGPLHGIPFGVKDVIDTAGWPSEAGSRVLRGRIPARDAAAVGRLRSAGAVILGKTVTHEFACGQDEPPTRNPWDATRYPGGSSAGSGVAVACGSAVAALGTDTGGSIRNPAAVNGIVGLKPTNGLVANDGVIPVSPTLDQVGPLARTVTDCALVLQALAGGDDPVARLDEPPAGLRIGVDSAWWAACGVQPAAAGAARTALRALAAAAGAQVVETRIPALALARPAGLVASLCETAAWHHDLLRSHTSEYGPGTRRMLALGALISGADLVVAQRVCEHVRRETRAALAGRRLDCLASPTLPDVAPPLALMASDFTRPADEAGALAGAVGLLIVANVCGLPAISLPCGASAAGLPLGLQLIGRPFADAELLRLARAYERATDWHARRPLVTGGERSLV